MNGEHSCQAERSQPGSPNPTPGRAEAERGARQREKEMGRGRPSPAHKPNHIPQGPRCRNAE